MRTRPWSIKSVSIFLALCPFAVFTFFVLKPGYPPAGELIQKFSWEIWALAAACLVTAYGVWVVRPWGFHAFFYLIAAVVFGDVSQLAHQPTFVFNWGYVTDLAFALAGAWFLYRERDLFYNPRLRWWERAPRFNVNIPSSIHLFNGGAYRGEVLNISSTGVLARVPVTLKEGDLVTVTFHLGNQNFTSPLKVIRQDREQNEAVGLEFADLTRQKRTEIARFVSLVCESPAILPA